MKQSYEFLAMLATDDVVITANRRLSSHLESSYRPMQHTQEGAWPRPKIMPLSQWLSEIWLQSNPTELLLDNQQSQLLWQSVIVRESEEHPLLNTFRAAELAQSAWQLLKHWKISLETLNKEYSEDILAFIRWTDQFDQHLEHNGWADSETLHEKCLPYLLLPTTTLPKKIILVGFDSFTPSIHDFFEAISAKTQVIVLVEDPKNSLKKRIVLSNCESEYRMMARWAKLSWENNPTQTIACVIPELLSSRRTVDRIFKEEFSEQFEHVINIAGGYSLLSYPMIQLSLTFIKFLSDFPLSQSQLTGLLLSPFIQGGISECQERALLDRECRRQQAEVFTASSLVKYLSQRETCPILLNILTETLSFFSQQSRENTPSQWAKLFSEIFIYMGWPGDQTLNSTEFQLAKSFQQQLQSYASFDWLLKKQSLNKALHTLDFLLSKTLFQAESTHDAPIQVLGILEAGALEVDKLWLCNMNDDIWPRPPAPNPFLPVHLQRELSMPRSSGTHEYAYAKQILDRLANSCTELIASYSQQDQKENRELSPSSLILEYSEINLGDLGLTPADIPQAQPQTEPWSDNWGPPVQPQEKLRGGASILKHQADCPFWAFAEIRLDARPFEESELGLSAAERGSLVHAVLAEIWHRLEDSDALNRFNESELNQYIHDCIFAVLQKNITLSRTLHQPDLSEIVCELESQRLQQLLLQWLKLEKTRSPFKVSEIEKPFHLTIAKLPLQLQVDRIDILEDGSEIIIDYKTGSPSPSAWFGERLDEPQLPLYALQNPTQVRGLAFAQIRAQSIKFNGLTAEAGQLPGVKASPIEWSVLIEEWQQALTGLAQEFCSGDARVDPKKFPATCAHCHLSSFCRINELEVVKNE